MCIFWAAKRWEDYYPDVLLECSSTYVGMRRVAGCPVATDGVGLMSTLNNTPPHVSASVTLKNLTISYNRHPAVHHVSGTFAAGSLTAIAGPNGAGKSTLIKAIASILHPDEGSITIEGASHEQVAYLPQATEMQRDFPMSVLHMVCTGFWHQTHGNRAITAEMREKAAHALAEVGLKDYGKCDLVSLSTGQFQRVLFARLLVQEAHLMLLDEPFTAMDEDTAMHLLELILRWHKQGRTIICVLHDFEQIRSHFPRCLLLARECLAWDASETVLQSEALMHSRFFKGDWQAQTLPCERST